MDPGTLFFIDKFKCRHLTCAFAQTLSSIDFNLYLPLQGPGEPRGGQEAESQAAGRAGRCRARHTQEEN